VLHLGFLMRASALSREGASFQRFECLLCSKYCHRALSAVWRRLEDHCRHQGACGDCHNTHAPGLACARAAALTGSAAASLPRGLILKARAVLQRADAPAGPAHACGGQSGSKSAPTGRRRDRQTRARGGLSPNTARFTASRPGDTVVHGEKMGGVNFLYVRVQGWVL
jgi:hypothetical protein